MSEPLSLRITEVFTSLQGEALTSGLPTTFIRLTGCPLRCVYCDSEYAFHGGSQRFIDDLVQEVGKTGVNRVCVTGGEPLAQPNCWPLLNSLCDSVDGSGRLVIKKTVDFFVENEFADEPTSVVRVARQAGVLT